jgi:4-hydroxybenzoate polyprenyltransferase
MFLVLASIWQVSPITHYLLPGVFPLPWFYELFFLKRNSIVNLTVT